MVAALEKAGASAVQFTRYPEQWHDSWTAAYNDPEVYQWMLSTRRGSIKGDGKVVLTCNEVVIVQAEQFVCLSHPMAHVLGTKTV